MDVQARLYLVANTRRLVFIKAHGLSSLASDSWRILNSLAWFQNSIAGVDNERRWEGGKANSTVDLDGRIYIVIQLKYSKRGSIGKERG
ncbi:hypothetical protein EAE96_002964 [Botrytis aclada]|nr:hypothetical protein EAE96_002964 [Botrytis aclada]